jgi:WD40 repeat protein/biotin carboxyl carrier protein
MVLTPAEEVPAMRRVIVGLVITLATSGGLYLWHWGVNAADPDRAVAAGAKAAAEAEGDKAEPDTAEPARPAEETEPLPEAGDGRVHFDPVLVGPCNLYPAAEQDVSSQVDGVCSEVLVKLGQAVRKGQVLARLDDRQLRPQIEALQIKASSKSAERIARAMHDEADSKVKYAEKANQSGLKAVSDLEYKTYLYQRERYAQEMAKAREEQQTAAKELERVRCLLALHEIRSELGGEVVKVYKRQGEAVKQAEPLFRVASFDRLRVEGLCKVSLSAPLRVGMRAVVEPEVSAGAMTRLSGHTAAVHALAVSPDGRFLASASEDKTVILWSWPHGVRAAVLPHPGEVHAVAFLGGQRGKSGHRLLTGCGDGRVRLWEIAANGKAGKPVVFARAHEGPVRAVAWSADGTLCASGGEDRRIAVWQAATGKHSYWLQDGDGEESTAHQGVVTSLRFAPDGQLLSAARDNTLKLWQAGPSSGKLLGTQAGRTGDVAQPGLSPDGKLVLFDHGEELRVLRRGDWAPLATLQSRKQGNFQSVALFSPTGRLVLAGASSGRLQLWKAPPSRAEVARWRQAPGSSPRPRDAYEVCYFPAPNGSALCAAFTPDERTVLTAGTDHFIHAWPVPAPSRWTEPLEAVVTFIGSQVERGTDTVRIRAELSNPTDPARRLRPGCYANLRLYPDSVEER